MENRNAVFIVTDLEGISGVDKMEQISEEHPEHRKACENLVLDTNAAIAGAFDAGAEAVYVQDGHGSGKNFIPGMLDPRAIQITMNELPECIRKVSATMQIGLHAMAGTHRAFLDHTQSSVSIHNYYFNDIRIGELMQDGVYSGHFGVPIVTVSGDRAACDEAEHFFPGVHTAVVKTAEERNKAVCLPTEEARRLIYEAAKAGYLDRRNIKPHIMPLPFTVTVEFNRTDYCDAQYSWRKNAERLDARTLRTIKNNIETYYDVLL